MKQMSKQKQEGLQHLAHDIISGKRILFITGAGLSVASGISTYRSEKNAIWNRFVTSWGTRKKFQEDPLLWWNHFWLRTHEKPEFLTAKPNSGHVAISQITQRCNARIITQNIDRLHCYTLNVPERLIEVHGRLGLYKCINDKCKYSWLESVPEFDLNDLAVEGTSLEAGNLELREAPSCPGCRRAVLPQSLLFDEKYESHSFYQWDLAQQWFEDCDVFIFIGTSFSVGVTYEALSVAEKEKKTVYNFNLTEDTFETEAYNILGRSEETLPMLYNAMLMLAGKPRMFFYPVQKEEGEKKPEEQQERVRFAFPPRMYDSTGFMTSPKRQRIY